jgi:hypothetical protein
MTTRMVDEANHVERAQALLNRERGKVAQMDDEFYVLEWYVVPKGDQASQVEQDQREDQRRGEAAVRERELGAQDHGL